MKSNIRQAGGLQTLALAVGGHAVLECFVLLLGLLNLGFRVDPAVASATWQQHSGYGLELFVRFAFVQPAVIVVAWFVVVIPEFTHHLSANFGTALVTCGKKLAKRQSGQRKLLEKILGKISGNNFGRWRRNDSIFENTDWPTSLQA